LAGKTTGTAGTIRTRAAFNAGGVHMNWFNRKKPNHERERFYLLPGMGGRARRRKEKVFLTWSVIVGVGTAVVLGLAIYWINNRQ
jgi:hypothetical protein